MSAYKRLTGWSAFIVVSTLVIFFAGGGIAFLRQPVGMIFIALWTIWWTAIMLGMRLGTPVLSRVEERIFTVLTLVAIAVLVVLPPWEYAHYSGPIPRGGPVPWIGLSLFAAGISLQSLAMWTLRGSFTFFLGVSPGRQQVAAGPYRWVRHPAYLSYIVILAGIGLALGSITALALMTSLLFFLTHRINHEERELLAKFGEQYLYYMKKTRWRLLPGVY